MELVAYVNNLSSSVSNNAKIKIVSTFHTTVGYSKCWKKCQQDELPAHYNAEH